MVGSRSIEFTMTRTTLLLRMMLAMTAVKIAVFALESPPFRQPQEGAEGQNSLQNRPYFPNQWRNLQSSSSFYTKYENYPPYCAIPTEMQDRKIPPLRDYLPKSGQTNHDSSGNSTTKGSLVGETRLVHVTAVIRHGARTPWSSEMKCWDRYWKSPETGKWDCDDLTTFMGPPSRNGTGGNKISGTVMLFEKKYDALNFPDEGLTNVLNGTCQMGQLIEQGYEQQITNGKILRDAYTYRKGEYEHDERMRLLNLRMGADDPIPWHQLYFRADDYQRTVMSGQVLLRGLFDPELESFRENYPNTNIVIPLHIADEDKDVLDANEKDCPRLKTIKEQAKQSPEYQEFNNSQHSQEIRDFMETKLKMPDDAEILDCLMCTLCTDRPLPNSVNDYDGSDRNWFSRLTRYGIQRYTTVLKHNNSEFAKLGIGPLWYEIMKHINGAIQEDEKTPKLALFAGHDTTLMPLLASLGPDLWQDTDWAAYASMMLIEIHELIDGRPDPEIYTSKFTFRLLFNGKILTPQVDGCHEDCELCDIVHLKAIVDPIATRDTDCSVPASSGEEASDESSSIKTTESGETSFASLSTTTGMAIFVALVLLSGFGGSAVTFAIMRKRFASAMNNKSVDFGGAWDIDDDREDEYGLELTEGGGFRD